LKKNVGDLDAYLRLTLGLTLLGYGIMRKSSLPIILGSMKITEGIFRWCPMSELMEISTTEDFVE